MSIRSRASRTSLKRMSAGGVVLALVALFGLPMAPAVAAGTTTVEVVGTNLVATANSALPAQTNIITIANSGKTGGGGVSIKDTGPSGPGTSLVANADCIQFSADEVRCDLGTITGVIVNAENGNDTVNVLNNSLASIVINGGDGNDTLNGGPLADTLNGDAGDDILKGGSGGDTLNGGANASLISQGDWVDYGASLTAIVVTVGVGAGDDGRDVSGAAGHQTEGDTVAGDVENVEGSNLADTITGFTNNNILRGGPGNDTLDGGAGDDELRGEDGADDLQGNAGTADAVSYATESSTVTVTIDNVADDGPPLEGDNVRVGIEIVIGGTGADNLTGGAGNETLRGMGGNDTLNGSLGTDVLQGGAGTDTVSYAGRANPVTINLDGLANDGEGGENDNVNADIENALGGSGADTLTGNEGPNNLNGGPGADVLNGGNGNDVLIGPAGDGAGDTYNGQGGTDRASFASAPAPVHVTAAGGADDGVAGETDNVTTTVENITGSPFDDTELRGNASRNVIDGGDGNDQLFGDEGTDVSNDTLNGGRGNDGLHGMNGADSMNGGPGPDPDPLTLPNWTDNDVIDGGGGIDTVSYSTRTANLNLTVNGVADDGQGAETDSIEADTEKITGGTGNDTISGDAGADTLTGGAGSDTISGAGGNDVLSGNGGNDTITGGGGRDTISGATGNDEFFTNDGLKDTINCGAGNDIRHPDGVDVYAANCFP